MSVLITRPEHDATTKHLAHWSQVIVDTAIKKGVEVFDLRKELANRKEVVGRLKKLEPRFVMLQDHRAKPFMESSNQVALALLKGHTASEASQRSKDLFRKKYLTLLSSRTNPDAIQDAQLLWWDMNHQVCLGDAHMRLI